MQIIYLEALRASGAFGHLDNPDNFTPVVHNMTSGFMIFPCRKNI
jgi:hypothetical protein